MSKKLRVISMPRWGGDPRGPGGGWGGFVEIGDNEHVVAGHYVKSPSDNDAFLLVVESAPPFVPKVGTSTAPCARE